MMSDLEKKFENLNVQKIILESPMVLNLRKLKDNKANKANKNIKCSKKLFENK